MGVIKGFIAPCWTIETRLGHSTVDMSHTHSSETWGHKLKSYTVPLLLLPELLDPCPVSLALSPW